MTKSGFYQRLEKKLKEDKRFVDEEGNLIKGEVINKAYQIDNRLIELLSSVKEFKDFFFKKVKDLYVFDINKFVDSMEKNLLGSSYTQFSQKIGLTISNKFIKKREEVALVWPYKDCVLEGGMTKEDEGRNEIFFNEVLDKDEIDRLEDPKVLTNFKKFTAKGEEKVKDFDRNGKGIIKDNLIIKGNNLLALHSLKEQFREQVKLIYIDPPYNPDNPNNTFTYNNNFKRSTWLTFMKNRLEVAREVLKEDGVLQIAIDENEQAYLGVLIDEIFTDYEKHCITIVHNPRGVQGKNFSYTNEFVYFIFKKGLKLINKIKRENPLEEEFKDHGGESLRTDAKNCFYPIFVKNNKIIGFGDVPNDSFHPKRKVVSKKDGIKEVWPIDAKGKERKWVFARQTVEEIKNKLFVKVKVDGSIDIWRVKDEKVPRTVWVGKRYDASVFGSKIVNKIINGKRVSFPKSKYAVYDCLYSVVGHDKEAIVLDFFAGSGTTGDALLELNKDGGKRNFILIEQLEEHVEVCKERIKQKIVKEKLKESFTYCEILRYNEEAIDKIQDAKDTKQLLKIWNEMCEKYFLNYDVDIKKFNDNKKDFEKMSLPEQKKMLVSMLDKNQLYVNLTEIEDSQFKVSKEDKELNKKFYGGK